MTTTTALPKLGIAIDLRELDRLMGEYCTDQEHRYESCDHLTRRLQFSLFLAWLRERVQRQQPETVRGGDAETGYRRHVLRARKREPVALSVWPRLLLQVSDVSE